MDLLETPLLEAALDFGSYSAPAAGSLWTCLAVVTAVFGFWRVRVVAFKPDHLFPEPTGSWRPTQEPWPLTCASATPPEPEPEQSLPPQTTHVGFCRKGTFFEAYEYSWDVDEGTGSGSEEEEEGGGGSGDDSDGEAVGGNGGFRREDGVGFSKRSDLGWYRFQDMTVLNGNAVKLWDDYRRVAAPSRKEVQRLVCRGCSSRRGHLW